MSRYISRRGFTLVELLVVIAIIGILIALLLPAVQAAREAARRAQCTNNIKQIALAFHNYHDTYKQFPIQITCHPDYTWSARGTGFLTRVLPYIEQQALADLMDPTLPVGDKDHFNVNTQVAQTPVAGFLCPSTDTDGGVMMNTRYVPTTPWAVACYSACLGSLWRYGDLATHHYWPSPKRGTSASGAAGTDWNGLLYGNNGIISTFLQPWCTTRYNTRISDIKDGTSSTFAVGEIVPKWRAHCAWYWPAMCSPVGPPLNYKSVYLMNNPTVTREERWMDWTNVYGFASQHPGGGNFAMADGSVRFVSDTIDLFTYRMLGNIGDGQSVQAP